MSLEAFSEVCLYSHFVTLFVMYPAQSSLAEVVEGGYFSYNVSNYINIS